MCKKGEGKRQVEVSTVCNKLEGLLGEMAKVRKVVSDLGETQVAQIGR